MKKLSALLFTLCFGLSGATATGQQTAPEITDKTVADSLRTANGTTTDGHATTAPSLPTVAGQGIAFGTDSLTDRASASAATELSLPVPYPEDLRPFHVSVPTDGRIAVWNSGGLFASGAAASLPGMMGVESGSLIFVQQAGRFTFTAHADAAKYGYFGGLQTTFGFGGSVSYQFSDRVSMTLFGSYYTPLNTGMTALHGPMTPGMQGYISIPNFGGYVDYRIGDRWGMKVGAQAYRSSMTNRIEAQPIVMPYYRLSKHTEIGLDVGGILYQLIKSNRGRSAGPNMNPTIAPPKFGPPPVR